jgi:hypothetical protein
MTTTAISVIQRVVDLLQDTTNVRWPAPELVRWLNDGQRAIQLVRPDATSVTTTATLLAGVRQDMKLMTLTKPPAKLMEVIRNVAPTSRMRPITKTSRTLLENHQPGWYAAAPSVDIIHFTFDPRDSDVFEVFPPAPAAPDDLAQVELTYSAYPTDVAVPGSALWTSVSGNIDVNDSFQLPLIDYIVYRAMSKDAETANAARAAAHLQAFQLAVNADMQGTLLAQPKTKEGAAA